MARVVVPGKDAKRDDYKFEWSSGTRAVLFVCTGLKRAQHEEEHLVLASISDDDDDDLVFTRVIRNYSDDTGTKPSGPVEMVVQGAVGAEALRRIVEHGDGWKYHDRLAATCGHPLEGVSGGRCPQNPRLTEAHVKKIIARNARYGGPEYRFDVRTMR